MTTHMIYLLVWLCDVSVWNRWDNYWLMTYFWKQSRPSSCWCVCHNIRLSGDWP